MKKLVIFPLENSCKIWVKQENKILIELWHFDSIPNRHQTSDQLQSKLALKYIIITKQEQRLVTN